MLPIKGSVKASRTKAKKSASPVYMDSNQQQLNKKNLNKKQKNQF